MKRTLVLFLMICLMSCSISLADILFGVQYAGGREILRTDKDNDTVWVEQSMVHTLIPSDPTGAPVVMVPGMGLGSYIFLSTPDGRKGWAQQFAENGHPVYVYDIPEYSTSGGFDVNKLNDLVSAIEVNIDDPNNPLALLNYPLSDYYSTGGKRPTIGSTDMPPTYSYYSTNSANRNIWSTWGFGSDTDMPYPDVRFPIAYMDQFEKHFPLRYKDYAELEDEAPLTGDLEAEVLIPLCESIGQPVILMLHSAAGAYLKPLLQARPDLFKAVINVEQAFMADTPRGTSPGDPEYDAAVNEIVTLLNGKPFISVYADYIDERGQANRKILSQEIHNAIIGQGSPAQFIDLPAMDIFGNTHLMMQDNNNDFIADLILDAINSLVIMPAAVDFNNNGCVDMDDLGMFSTKWKSTEGEPQWDPAYDIKPDSKVDIQDLSLFGTVWIQCD